MVPFTLPSTATLRSAFFVNSQNPGEVLTGESCWATPNTPETCWNINEMFLATGLAHRINLSNAWLASPTDEYIQSFDTHMKPYLDTAGGRTLLPQAQMTTLQYDADPAALPLWRSVVEPLNSSAVFFVYVPQCDEIYDLVVTSAQPVGMVAGL